ncbi:MAG TPA: NAD-dependent epimerase/dehydratase family protein [Kofleriaceae bacterium]|jgi:CDP-glucose 4,6-dehydratase|nr:NAD-dependent epimerase/dehydratase family protein [Kofleriaceae bacterium]
MSFWTDRPVFVTGATGLLGSHLTEELVARGADVTVLVRDSVARSRFVALGLDRKVTIVRGALEDYPTLERALNEYEIESVFHLGAQTIVGTANRSPLATFEANVRGTYNLLEAARVNHKKVRRVVVASSDKAYGAQPVLPYDEDAPLIGRFPYDCSKSCTDLITKSYHVAFGVPACVTRCGNLYGAGDLNWNRLVPGTIRSAIRGERPIIRSDGTFVRDYFYVGDAVAAYLELAENMDRQEIVGEAFNFSDDKPLSVVQMAKVILEAAGRPDLELDIRGEATNEIPEQFLSSAKANRLLSGWKPRFGMQQGLATTIEWYRKLLAQAA